MISDAPESAAVKRMKLAEACEAEARAWRRRAALNTANAELYEEVAEACEAVGIRHRLAVITAEVEEETLSALMCPVEDCTGCHPELTTIVDVVAWLRSDSLVSGGHALADSTDVQRLAYSLLLLRDGVRAGRWGHG